jgi:hypothetical protein
VIDKETITSLTVKTTKAFDTCAIRRRTLNNETKIDGNALIALRSTTRRVDTTCSLVKLGFDTDRAVIEGTRFGNGRDTGSELMGLSKTPRVDMTKALVPQVTEMVTSQLANKGR